MIDIHTHILPNVDDGSESIEESIAMLQKAEAIGIKHVFLTPHAHRYGMKTYSKETLIERFSAFAALVQEANINVFLYLGNEVTVTPKFVPALRNDEFLTLNNKEYLLIELPYDEAITDFYDLVHSAKVCKKRLIIAHIERYDYYSIKQIAALKKLPIMLQVNGNSITGYSGSFYQKRALKLIKEQLVDFVASDVHAFRTNDLNEAYEIVKKMQGESYAKDIFYERAKVLL